MIVGRSPDNARISQWNNAINGKQAVTIASNIKNIRKVMRTEQKPCTN